MQVPVPHLSFASEKHSIVEFSAKSEGDEKDNFIVYPSSDLISVLFPSAVMVIFG